MERRVLNVRDVPDDLLWAAKTAATQLRITLRQFVLDAIAEKLGQQNRTQP